jgi:hypothetical protein
MTTDSRIIRKFERFLFNGIPEQPESTWERDGNTYVSMRESGKSLSNFDEIADNAPFTKIGEYRYDLKNGKTAYKRLIP